MSEMQAILSQFSDTALSQQLLQAVREQAQLFKEKTGRKASFMEVCGSHTMALAKSGIRKILADDVEIIAGPGCPVCVTDQKSIDAMIALANGDNRIICTFGDMMRVPGTKESLMDARSNGRDVRVVYAPVDAVAIAEENPEKEVVFLGIGFETTIPVLGVAIQTAIERNVPNFSMWVTTKLIEPVMRTLLDTKEVDIDAFLLPGHVAIVLGEQSFHYLVEEYNVPGVVAGFEPVELLTAVYQLLHMLNEQKADIKNEYNFVVTKEGNKQAQRIMETYFEPVDEAWRGMGIIPKSGMDLKEEYASLNAKKRFSITPGEPRKTKCRCGEIIRGIAKPQDCVLFGKACTPLKPIGPCMVSSEGSCSAYYQYMRE